MPSLTSLAIYMLDEATPINRPSFPICQCRFWKIRAAWQHPSQQQNEGLFVQPLTQGHRVCTILHETRILSSHFSLILLCFKLPCWVWQHETVIAEPKTLSLGSEHTEPRPGVCLIYRSNLQSTPIRGVTNAVIFHVYHQIFWVQVSQYYSAQ